MQFLRTQTSLLSAWHWLALGPISSNTRTNCKSFRAQNLGQGIVMKTSFETRVSQSHTSNELLFSLHWYIYCHSHKQYVCKTKKGRIKVLMQGKLFQRCTHFLYCSVLSLGGKVNTKRMSQPDMKSIFTKIIYKIFWS